MYNEKSAIAKWNADMYDRNETGTGDVEFALSVIGGAPRNILDESVPRLIQSNGTSHRETPGNKAFSRQAAHGSLFLLPESQSGGNM